jgi:vacuolar-type H+-ATPase subunit H
MTFGATGLGMPEVRDPVSEIERLLDELEAFAEKSPWYLPNKIAIRDEDFFRITQRIRELLPSELSEARRMIEQRDTIMRNAQDEHKRIIESAERRLEDLTSQEKVVVTARMHAERILDDASQQAASLRQDALKYTASLLQSLEQDFNKTLLEIQRGREFLAREIDQEGQEAALVAEAGAEGPSAT